MKKVLIKKVFLLHVVYNAFSDVIKLGTSNWSVQFVFFVHFSVSEFAKKTGDFRSLSAVDLRVLGLTYQLEKEFCDAEHIKDEPYKKVGRNALCVWKSHLEEFSRMRVYIVYFLCFWKQSPKGVFQNEVSYIFLPPFLPPSFLQSTLFLLLWLALVYFLAVLFPNLSKHEVFWNVFSMSNIKKRLFCVYIQRKSFQMHH